jgi:VanZ family protein
MGFSRRSLLHGISYPPPPLERCLLVNGFLVDSSTGYTLLATHQTLNRIRSLKHSVKYFMLGFLPLTLSVIFARIKWTI